MAYPPLTAGKPYPDEHFESQNSKQDQDEKERLVFDKISIVFEVPVFMTENTYSKIFYEKLHLILSGCEKEYKPNDNFEYNVKYGEIFVSWGRGVADSKGSMLRLEFNPDKVNKKSLQPILQLVGIRKLKESRITRLDVAIDYRAVIDPLMFYDKNKRKHSVYWGKSNGAESVYLGSKKSDILIRIYNKSLQQKECFDIDPSGSWWRVEAQIQKGYDYLSYFENPFKEMLYIEHLELKKKSNELFQRLAEYYVKREGIQSLLTMVPVGSRTRIKNLFVESKNLRKPKEVFEEMFYVLWCEYKHELENMCGV